jgi:hypothetical protein
MSFFLRDGWQFQFLEADAKTVPPRKFTFADPEKIRELAHAEKPGGLRRLGRWMLEHGIETGRGGCYLRLTPGQHAKLRRA